MSRNTPFLRGWYRPHKFYHTLFDSKNYNCNLEFKSDLQYMGAAYFKTGKSNIQQEWVKIRFTDLSHAKKIIVLGTTDDTGPESRHIPLSIDRANSLVTYLKVEKQVAVKFVPFGCERGLGPNNTEEARQENRKAAMYAKF